MYEFNYHIIQTYQLCPVIFQMYLSLFHTLYKSYWNTFRKLSTYTFKLSIHIHLYKHKSTNQHVR